MRITLTDLNWLNVGSIWPPPAEASRMELYCKNRDLFEGDHANVYADQFKRIERVIGNFQEVVSYTFVANFQKLVSLKVADLLFGETPKITAGDDPKGAQQIAINDIIERSNLHNASYENAIDVSRFGTGLFQVYGDNGGTIGVMCPNIWYPVVDPRNIKRVLYHVLAWTPDIDMNHETREMSIPVVIHERGAMEERTIIVKDGKIIRSEEGTRVDTGLSDFAIVPVHNIITSDRIVGIDDYTDLDSIVSEILVRCSQIAKVLDKFSNPSVSGPSTALEYDESSGMYKFKVGGYFARDSKEDANVEYLVWDASLEANFTFLEKAINLLHNISEVGALIFADQLMKTGQVTGTGMRKMMMQALAKTNRIRMRMDPALKKALSLASEIDGANIDVNEIGIGWQDGLPIDDTEQATVLTTLYAGGLMSLETALKRLGFDGDALQEEIDRITKEKQAAMASEPDIKPRIQLEPNTEEQV